jgi:hypothetical protein
MAESSNLNTIVVQTLEKQVDILASQRDILTRIELLLSRMIEMKTSSYDVGASRGTIEGFFSHYR